MDPHRRDRSVKHTSAHDTWQADAPGKIGNANMKRTIERSSSFFLAAKVYLQPLVAEIPV